MKDVLCRLSNISSFFSHPTIQHDLIQQEVYESMDTEERQAMHLRLGEFLGKLISDNDPSPIDPVTLGLSQLQLNEQTFYSGRSFTSSLISIACDQLDSAGPDAVEDEMKRLTFAEYNLSAGQKSSHQGNHRAALYYYSKGIEFLGNECWLVDYQLCLALHHGAVSASFSLAEADDCIGYAEKVVEHVSFEDSLKVLTFILKSLAQSGRHDQCISRGLSILRKLKFDIPLSPSKETTRQAMASTDSILSQFSVDQILSLCDVTIDDSVLNIIRIMDSFYVSCYASASPFCKYCVNLCGISTFITSSNCCSVNSVTKCH